MTFLIQEWSFERGQRRRAASWAALLALAAALAALLSLIHFPAAPLLGAMVAGIAFGVGGSPNRVPRPAYLLSQGMAGVFIASTMTPAIFVDMVRQWPVLLLMTALTISASFAVGWALNLWARIDRDEALLGSLPGMSGAMVIIATERGVDARVVALMQYVRLAGVIFTVAALANLLPNNPPDGAEAAAREATTLSYALAIGVSLLALPAARLRALPAAGMLAPMMIGAAIEATDLVSFALPEPLIWMTFLVIGLEVGLKFNREVLAQVLRLTPVVIGATAVLILTGAVFGVVLHLVTGLDLLSALLATAPGSTETVALVAVASQANVAAVLAFQTVRMFTVVLFGPAIMERLARLPIWRRPDQPKSSRSGT